MKKANMIARGAAVVALALGAGATVSTPASAAIGDYCASGYACIWGDTDYRTDSRADWEVRFQYEIFNYGSYYYMPFFYAHDNATSVYNNGNLQSATFFKDINQAGPNFTLAKKTGDWNLSDSSGSAPGGFQDELDSGCFSGRC